MSVERIAMLLTAILFWSRGSSAQDSCIPDAVLTLSYKHTEHYLFRGEMMYVIEVDKDQKKLYLEEAMPINKGFFKSWNRPKVTRAYSWRYYSWAPFSDDSTIYAVIGDHNMSTYIEMEGDSREVKDEITKSGDSLVGVTLTYPPAVDSRAFFYSDYMPGMVYYQAPAGSRNVTYFRVKVDKEDKTTVFFWTTQNDLHGKNYDYKVFNYMHKDFRMIGIFKIGKIEFHSGTSRTSAIPDYYTHPMVAFVLNKTNGRAYHTFTDVSDWRKKIKDSHDFEETDPRIFNCPMKKLPEKTSSCVPEAALTISQELGLHFLFRDDMMYKINVDYDKNTISLKDSFPIREKYFRKWKGEKVTRAWAWRSDDYYLDHYLAVIGDHEFNYYIRVRRSDGEVDYSDGMFSKDSMNFLSMDPVPNSRTIFYSQYEPGYLLLEEYEGNDKGRHYYQVSIDPKEFRVNFWNTEALNGKNPKKDIKLFNPDNLDNSMKLIGVFMIGESSPDSQKMVVFAMQGDIVKHCFGDVNNETCNTPDGYKETILYLFGCGPPPETFKTSETEATTEATTQPTTQPTTEETTQSTVEKSTEKQTVATEKSTIKANTTKTSVATKIIVATEKSTSKKIDTSSSKASTNKSQTSAASLTTTSAKSTTGKTKKTTTTTESTKLSWFYDNWIPFAIALVVAIVLVFLLCTFIVVKFCQAIELTGDTEARRPLLKKKQRKTYQGDQRAKKLKK